MDVNNIYNGDCYDLIKELKDKSVDCIYTDIPYLYDHYGKTKSEIGKRITKQHQEQMSKIINGIDLKILDEFVRVMKKINCFIWCSRLQIPDILNYFLSQKKKVNFEILVWCKTNTMPLANNCWLSDIEYCLYFREEGIRLNGGIKLKSKWYTSAANKEDKKLYKHPTIKPLNLVKKHIEHAVSGGVVLDPFCGSGTTCVACKELGFDYIGMEIEKDYCEIANDRINGISIDGQTSIFTNFDEV